MAGQDSCSSSLLSEESLSTEEDDLAYLDCGLPIEDLVGESQCRGCFATFPENDETHLSTAWVDLKTLLGHRGYTPAMPAMDRHFERVFFLLVKDWQGRIQDVGFMYDSDAEYVPSEESSAEFTDE